MSSTDTPARLTMWGFGLLAIAVGAGTLVYFVLVREHVRVDRGGSHHYWTTYPLGESTALAVAWAAVALAGCGLLCLVLAAFLGPEPVWRSHRDGRSRVFSGGFVAISVLIAIGYAVLSLPLLDEESIPWEFLIGGICGVAALRASSYAVAVPLGIAAIALVVVGSAAAVVVLGHGALAIGLVALLAVAIRAERSWVRGLAAAGFVLGLFGWVYLGLLLMLLLGCEYGGACLS